MTDSLETPTNLVRIPLGEFSELLKSVMLWTFLYFPVFQEQPVTASA